MQRVDTTSTAEAKSMECPKEIRRDTHAAEWQPNLVLPRFCCPNAVQHAECHHCIAKLSDSSTAKVSFSSNSL